MNKSVLGRAGLLCLAIAVSSVDSAFSQGPSQQDLANFTKLVDILPPSPNAAALGKYGNAGVALSSGMVNISIPIFDYQSTSLKLPLSISYSSNGFKVDEIASRVGTSWVLNAGGVITRTVLGDIDEESQRIPPPAEFPSRTTATLNYLKTITNTEDNNYDAEPDLFSFNFNGYTGKFILDNSMNPVLLEHSNLKIEKDFGSATWDFRITTGDGVQYCFGGTTAREQTGKYQSGTGCGKIYRSFAVTAWYLNKIVHPNGDVINFSYAPVGMNYKTGISQSAISKVPNTSACQNCPTLQATTCVNWLTTQGVMLQEISSSGGARVKLSYTDRLDLDDKLLSKIEVYQPNGSIARAFNFNYANAVANSYSNAYVIGSQLFNRPFLVKLIERSMDSSLTRAHQFFYNDIENLPPRLSFAQDHYGFFNGKSNGSLLTYGSESWLAEYFPQARADREPSATYGSKGLLTKIVYPAGGEENIVYEGNTVYKRVEIPPPTRTLGAQARSDDVAGGEGEEIAYSDTVEILYGQTAVLYASVSSGGEDPIHNKGIVTVYAWPSGVSIFSGIVSPTQPLSQQLHLQEGVSYYIKVVAAGVQTRVAASFAYLAGAPTYVYQDVPAAGIRVKEIVSKSIFSPESIKRYYYSNLSTPDRSSAGIIYTPGYYKMLTIKVPCQDPNGGLPDCSYATCENYVLYSNAQNNIYIYPNAPITYADVVESFGENFENGGVEHKYTVAADIPGNSIMGNNILSAPLTNNGWKNGRETYQRTFRKVDDTYVPVQEIFTNYKEDSRIDNTSTAYIANKKYEAICQGDPPLSEEFDAFDVYSYAYLRKWSYIDNVRTLVYDEQGQNYIEHSSMTEYGNAQHALPTKVTTASSDAKTEVINNYYPSDLTLTGSEETARQKLIEKNMLSTVLLQQSMKNNSVTVKLKTGYNIFPNGLLLPQTQSVQIAGNSMEKRVEFYQYNNAGKMLEQSKSDDVHEVYLWGYKNLYPVARIIGSDYASVAAYVNQSILDNPASDQQLRDEIDKIREGLAGSKALVRTYTYLPLVGMTSETDPNGRTTYYEYDGLGRLKLIKDQNGKILKQYDYQYQKPITQ